MENMAHNSNNIAQHTFIYRGTAEQLEPFNFRVAGTTNYSKTQCIMNKFC